MLLKFGIIVSRSVKPEAAHVVTGLSSFSSIQSMYTETSRGKLKTWKEFKKLTLFYKIINDQELEYLTGLVLPTVTEINSYNVRNHQNISQMPSRLSILFTNSYYIIEPVWNEDIFIF